MIVEKFRWYSESSIINQIIMDFSSWHTLTYNDLARPRSSSWGEVLKDRKAIYIKNQGKSNDNSSSCQIEIYFGPYAINSHEAVLSNITYTPATYIFRLDFGGTFVPVKNRSWITLKPFNVGKEYDQNALDGELTYVNSIGGDVYDFKIDLDVPDYGNQTRKMLATAIASSYKKSKALFNPTFYDYTIPALTTERGIILEKGEDKLFWMTYNQILYYRAVNSHDVDSTIVIMQLA